MSYKKEIVSGHFNLISSEYDNFKKRHWYYYMGLKRLLHEIIPSPKQNNILEIGCGTGDLLAFLSPRRGIGVDISEKMIQIARQKHVHQKNLIFSVGSAEELKLPNETIFDYIFLFDVIEHLSDVPRSIENVNKICDPDTKVIISMINPFWEPFLLVAEKLKLKMPEGPHYRISFSQLKILLHNKGFRILHHDFRTLIPIKLPFSDFINSVFYKIPGLKYLGFVEFLVFAKK